MPRYRLSRAPAGLAGIDLAEVERVLVKHHANVTAAARELNVSSHDLRRLTWSKPRLIDTALEEAHRLIDRAEENFCGPFTTIAIRIGPCRRASLC